MPGTLTAVPGIRVGHARVPGGGSGCTVVLGPFRGWVEVLGMATGSRELHLLDPLHLSPTVQALLLTGGSAFGLAAAQGVMDVLEERGQGFPTPGGPVPLVPGAVIFDLADGVKRPGPEEGRKAAEGAAGEPVAQGRVGAGSGATVGKILGPERSSSGGVGSAAEGWREFTVGALAVVNALGDVREEDGSILAGARREDGGFRDTERFLREDGGEPPGGSVPGLNTTLAVVATDLSLRGPELGRVARMAAGAFSRAITPVSSPFDGDLLFVLSTAPEAPETERSPEALLSLGVRARALVEEAIRNAVRRVV